jgi:hypothetical protein
MRHSSTETADEVTGTLAPLARQVAMRMEKSYEGGQVDLGALHKSLLEAGELVRVLGLLRPGARAAARASRSASAASGAGSAELDAALSSAFRELLGALGRTRVFLERSELELYLAMLEKPNAPAFGGELAKILIELEGILEAARDELALELGLTEEVAR